MTAANRFSRPPMTMLFPSGWMWEPRQGEYEPMNLGVYAVLGVFLLIASRQPAERPG